MYKRTSNIELLRITAMLMIIACHIFSHCVNIQLTDINYITALGNGHFCNPGFSKKLCVLAIIPPMGASGNAIFILISGYFMAHRDTIDLTKIAKKLLLWLGFAAIILGFVSIYAYRHVTQIPITPIPFHSFNTMSWYVGYYFIIVVLAKIYLNGLLNKLEQKKYAMLLIVLFALLQFTFSTSIIANLAGGLEIVCTGIFLYSLGGYIRKYNPFDSFRLWAVLATVIVINIIIIGNFYITTAANILTYDASKGELFIQNIGGYSNNQLVPLILGIAIFELFRRMQIPGSRVLTFLGSSTFMVYLIHDNAFVHKLWHSKDWVTLLHENTPLFLATYGTWTLITFAAGVVCYSIFIIGSKLLQPLRRLAVKQTAQNKTKSGTPFKGKKIR